MKPTVIFDLGNVLFRFHEDELTQLAIGVHPDREQIARAVFDREIWDRLDVGDMDDEEAKSAICAELPQRLWDAACRVFDGWVENMPSVEGMDALLDDLEGKCRLLLISNISKGFVRNYSRFPRLKKTLSRFEKCYFSGELSMVKPDARIFSLVLEENGLDPKDCIFIDDSSVNLCGCESVGIEGYLFDGDVARLREYLLWGI